MNSAIRVLINTMINTKIPIYSLMILLALIANIPVIVYTTEKYRFTNDERIGALFYENIGILFGAKLLTAIQIFISGGKFSISRAGLSSFGAVIGAIICVTIFGWQFHKSIKKMLFTYMPSIPLMYALGKIGCFMAGCCHGIEYGGWGHVVYNYSKAAPKGVELFPVQLVETAAFIFIFIFMLHMTIRNKFNMRILGVSFVLCGAGKFTLDILRMSHIGQIISYNQWISVFFIVLGIIILLRNETQKH